MTTTTKPTENRPEKAAPKKRRRKRGVPTLLVIILLIIAILMGGLLGFAVARKTDTSRAALQDANARIAELENTLTLIGFSTGEDSPDNWIYDDSGEPDTLGDLSGEFEDGGDSADDDSALWDEDTLLSGMLSEPSEPVVVAEFDGGQLLSDEVIPEYNEQLTTQIFAGYNADDISDSLLQEVLSYLVNDKIIAAKAKDLGLDQLTEDDLGSISTEASEIYNELVSYYAGYVDGTDKTQEEINTAAAAMMADQESTSLESITQELKDTWWAQKFFDYTVKDVAVADTEVQTYYNEILAEQKELYDSFPEEYEYAHIDGETILYNLDGYRAVKHILISFSDEESEATAIDLTDQISQLDPATDAAAIQEYQVQLDALYAPLEKTAQEILDKLQAGSTFDALIAEYGNDDAMLVEPTRSQGYYVSTNSNLWSSEFTEASLILDKVGDISSPVHSTAGVHLIQYVADVTPGEVPLTSVYDAIKEEALSLNQSAYYAEQVQSWLETANVKYYPELLQ